MIQLLGFIDFENPTISKNIYILMFLIIAFKTKLKNVTLILSLKLFG